MLLYHELDPSKVIVFLLSGHYIILTYYLQISLDTKQVKDYSKVVNPECGVWHQKDFSSVEFQVLTENNVNFSPPNLPKHLEVNLGKTFF